MTKQSTTTSNISNHNVATVFLGSYLREAARAAAPQTFFPSGGDSSARSSSSAAGADGVPATGGSSDAAPMVRPEQQDKRQSFLRL